MTHEIRIDNSLINQQNLKQQIEFKYPGYKVINIDPQKLYTYIEFIDPIKYKEVYKK